MFRLDNKIALVTGAGSGIGAAIAQTFITAGATVLIADRDEIAATKLCHELRLQGKADIQVLDVSSEASCQLAAQQILQKWGRVDVLVNNAGIGHVGTLLETTADDIDRLHAVNVRGLFNMCKAFMPSMIERQSGTVVNLASIGGITGVRDRLAYCASKFAVVGLTKAMAIDHAHQGVRINCICPARVETPFVQSRLAEYDDPEAAYREMSQTQPVGRMGKPQEIAAAALYLASDEAAFVTGEALVIDGGWNAGR